MVSVTGYATPLPSSLSFLFSLLSFSGFLFPPILVNQHGMCVVKSTACLYAIDFAADKGLMDTPNGIRWVPFLNSEKQSNSPPLFWALNPTVSSLNTSIVVSQSLDGMNMESIDSLPQLSELSPSLLSFLGENFREKEDLQKATDLVSELKKDCDDLSQSLVHLNRRLEASLLSYASHSDQLGGLIGEIDVKLSDIRSSTGVSGSLPDGKGENSRRAEQILGKELPALAKEVARVETVRIYAETALKLDTLVGDIEDTVSSTMTRNLKKQPFKQNSEEMRMVAIKSLKLTEDVLTSIIKTHPQWNCLVSAVDHRVDRALAILRPQAIADHRNLLASLGWPPPLSALTSTNYSSGKSSEVQNPLFTMQGDLKHHYCENFLALCSLQDIQRQRKSRQLEGHNLEVALHQPLWAIEELVNPVSLASQRHFSKWIKKPEFIFALVYKITRDFVDSMDELLQPLVDKARLVGYSCREEWVSAMVTSLTTYLAKEIFPAYVLQLEEDSVSSLPSQAKISWLNLVDLMIAFDKRVKSLISNSGITLDIRDDENLRRISSISVFCDCPDWLDLWAEIELGDALDKLRPEMEDERCWTMKMQGSALLTGFEDHKSPAVSATFVHRLSAVIDRCRSLPGISLRVRFIRLAAAPIIREFLAFLLRRCQEAEGLTALADDDALIKVTNSINAARYCESVLKEWSEDVFFLELQDEHLGTKHCENNPNEEAGSGIFYEEIRNLVDFRTEWVEKIATVVLRGFDARCRDYMKNKKQWQEKEEEGWTVSKPFVVALDYLEGIITKLEGGLNGIDFVAIWKSVASVVDRLVFNGILMSNVKFYDGGVERFGGDMEVLFGVFRAWCLRPEGFFPKVSEGLKLLRMEKQPKGGLEGGRERWLKENGIRNLPVVEAEKILKNRCF